MIIAGIDEAGYGPLLGPLVVSATAFEVASQELCQQIDELPCLWSALNSGVSSKKPCKKGRVLVADSKIIHNLSDGDRILERGVLSFASLLEPALLAEPYPLARLLALFACENHGLSEYRWYQPDSTLLPYLADIGDVRIAGNMLKRACAKAGVAPVAMRTAVVPEKRFNQMISNTHNKASALISITLKHLYDLHQLFGARGLVVGIDKQGARDKYTDLLLKSFPDAALKVLQENEDGSSYIIHEGTGEKARQTVVHFREKSETKFLPTALASMICKFLRELCMHNFNAWWAAQIPDLKPTAGYYTDGMRWLADVEPHLANMGITREELIRIR